MRFFKLFVATPKVHFLTILESSRGRSRSTQSFLIFRLKSQKDNIFLKSLQRIRPSNVYVFRGKSLCCSILASKVGYSVQSRHQRSIFVATRCLLIANWRLEQTKCHQLLLYIYHLVAPFQTLQHTLVKLQSIIGHFKFFFYINNVF